MNIFLANSCVLNIYVLEIETKKGSLKKLCLCVCVWLCIRVSAGTHRNQKGVSDLLELECQAVVTCLTWVLGTEVRSSPRAACAPNSWPSLQL